MGALKLTACMKVVSKMGEMDQESLLERLDRYTADGVPKDRAQVMAAADTLAELQDERREFMAMLREQHPDLFVVSRSIPEDQDVDPDAPDIKRSPARQIETPEFKAWSEGLPVHDSFDGRSSDRGIYKLFHMTTADFSEFKPGGPNPSDSGPAIWLSADPAATSAAFRVGNAERGFRAGARTMPVYAKVKNPLVIDDAGMLDYARNSFADGSREFPQLISKRTADALKEDGYDSIIFDGPGVGWKGASAEVIVLDGKQIKSAIGNSGAFDPATADITRSPARNDMGFYSALAKGVEDMQTKQAPAGAWKTQIKGLVNKGQVKQDEIEWSGLEDFLDLQEGKVTKDQILEYLRGNGVQVEEVTLGATGLDGVGEMYVDEANDYGDEWAVFTEEGGIIGGTYSTREEAEDAMASMSQDLPSKYSQYTLPGGENYREVLLTLPTNDGLPQPSENALRVARDVRSMIEGIPREAVKPFAASFGERYGVEADDMEAAIWAFRNDRTGVYQSSHWSQPNVIAHIRVNDRADADGRRVLFVEEVQSDWGQDGKKKGFKLTQEKRDALESQLTNLELQKNRVRREGFRAPRDGEKIEDADQNFLKYQELQREYEAVENQLEDRNLAPLAPFVAKTDGWLNLALKRVIAMAVDGGYDAVAFVNGDQSADRYDLSKQVERIEYDFLPADTAGVIKAFGFDGEQVVNRSAKPEDLPDIIGKEVAAKLMVEPSVAGTRTLTGDGLKVGGEGMKAFYDKIVPNAVKALLKKVGGGQLEMVSIPDPEGTGRTMEVSRSPMFGGGRETIAIADEPPLQQPGFAITDAMREKVSTEGLTLFSRARDMTDTPEFKAWFGDSQVVDSQGKPLVVYHGTAGDIESFNPTRVGSKHVDVLRELSDAGLDPTAFYFTDDAKTANWYAKNAAKRGAGANVMPVYLSLQNPLVVDFQGEGIEYLAEELERAKEDGRDGLIARNFDDGGVSDHYIAFRPEQIKSATGNRGTFDPNDADITRSPGRTATGAAWDSPSASKWDDAVYKLQDKQVDLKRVTDAIQEAGGAIADDLNVYLQEELYHGRAAKRTEDFVNMELNPLVEQLARDGLKLEDLEEFLHARHAKEANEVIAQRNPGVQDLQDGGSGMKTGDAQQYLASLPADLRQKLESAAAKVDDILKATRELYVDYELESRDTVDAWGRMFQHYIPLMREDKDGSGSPGLGQGFSVKGRETKGRTGSTRKVVDIMANIAMQRERAIVRGEKNRVSQALVGLATANPNEGFWKVDEVPTERVFNEKTGLVEDRVDPLYKSRPNAVIAKIKGANGQVKEHAVLFNEEDPRALRMAEALKNLDANQIEGLLGVSAQITRYFAAVNTQYNPVFGVVNLVRDVQGALLNLTSTPLAGDQTKIAKYTMSALRGIYGDAREARKGNSPSSQWANLWDEFQEVGGQTGYRDLFKTSADRAEAIKKTLNPDAWADSKLGKIFTANGALKVPMAQAKRTAGWLFDWLSDYNLAMENGVRLAAYKAGLERGMSKEQAASAAKNLTVNFNRKGQVSQQAGAMYAFFNASLQGTARIAQTLFDMEPGKPKTIRLSSTGKKIVYGGMLLGVTQALALAAAGFNDEDPPEFARERSLIIPVGGKKYITIPMPLGFHVLPSIGRVATEFTLSGFKNPHERALQLASLFADTFNPIGNAGLSMQTLAPTALDPLVALTENKDWTGKPIARESSNKAIPGHALGRDTATSLAKLLSEGINTLSGGNKYTAGVFSPTPDQIDYLLGQVTGGVGRELSKVEQTVLSTARGEELPTYKIPLVGRFVGDAKSQASEGTAFYANTERLNRLETEIKGLEKDGKRAEADELRRNSSEAYLITMANQAERQIQKLRTEKRELVKANAPREQVKAVEDRITAVMARLNRAAESLREKQNS